MLAFDIASDAVKVAARSDAPVKWMVADITNIPVKDGAADVVLDVFTPANYGEFRADTGRGRRGHQSGPRRESHGPAESGGGKAASQRGIFQRGRAGLFLERFDLLERFTVSRTVPVDRKGWRIW